MIRILLTIYFQRLERTPFAANGESTKWQISRVHSTGHASTQVMGYECQNFMRVSKQNSIRRILFEIELATQNRGRGHRRMAAARAMALPLHFYCAREEGERFY